MTSLNIFAAKIGEYVQASSLKVLLQFSNSTNGELNLEPSGSKSIRVRGHEMALILVSNDALKFTFKVHYQTLKIAGIVGRSLNKDPSALNDREINAFAKEYCNLIAGKLRDACSRNGILLDLSIPWHTRGFDDIFYHIRNHAMVCNSAWYVNINDVSIVCSLSVELVMAMDFPELGDLEPPPNTPKFKFL